MKFHLPMFLANLIQQDRLLQVFLGYLVDLKYLVNQYYLPILEFLEFLEFLGYLEVLYYQSDLVILMYQKNH
jgi:hypothetical protein